jgi:hypothetical protein
MPIPRKSGESKDDWMGKCIGIEINNGKDPSQAAAICYAKWDELSATSSVTDNTWSTEAPINVNLSKISYDYDETLSTPKGMEMAKKSIENGDTVYIISARRDKGPMLARAKELGIPESRVFATGSNKAKAEKVKELGITKHIDNNPDVVSSLPGIGYKFGKVRRIIFDEDFNEEDVRHFKSKGYSVHIKSKRKIYRRDNKVWNRLKSVGLTEDAMVFGEVKDLDKRYDYELVFCGEGDPILNKLLLMGEKFNPKSVIKSQVVNSMEEAIALSNMHKDVEMKLVSIKTVYTYGEIPGIPPAKSGSRTFCSKMMGSNRQYSIDEILSLPTQHLLDMGLPGDVFQFRGGFYRNPDSQQTTPWCRHQWKVNVIVER